MLGVGSEYLAYALGTDPAYTAPLVRIPVSRKRGLKTVWMRKQPFTLGALVEFGPDAFAVPPQTVTAIGRNCGLYRADCKWKYRNQSFDFPCSERKVGLFAKSIERWADKCERGERGFVKVAARSSRNASTGTQLTRPASTDAGGALSRAK